MWMEYKRHIKLVNYVFSNRLGDTSPIALTK